MKNIIWILTGLILGATIVLAVAGYGYNPLNIDSGAPFWVTMSCVFGILFGAGFLVFSVFPTEQSRMFRKIKTVQLIALLGACVFFFTVCVASFGDEGSFGSWSWNHPVIIERNGAISMHSGMVLRVPGRDKILGNLQLYSLAINNEYDIYLTDDLRLSLVTSGYVNPTYDLDVYPSAYESYGRDSIKWQETVKEITTELVDSYLKERLEELSPYLSIEDTVIEWPAEVANILKDYGYEPSDTGFSIKDIRGVVVGQP